MVLCIGDSLGHTAAVGSELAIRSLGAVVWHLKYCLMDQELLSLRSFVKYTPVDIPPADISSRRDAFYIKNSHMVWVSWYASLCLVPCINCQIIRVSWHTSRCLVPWNGCQMVYVSWHTSLCLVSCNDCHMVWVSWHTSLILCLQALLLWNYYIDARLSDIYVIPME